MVKFVASCGMLLFKSLTLVVSLGNEASPLDSLPQTVRRSTWGWFDPKSW